MNLLIVLIAYLVGSLSTGYWLVKFQKNIDIRSYGSGNIGARNVSRLLGKKGFILTFIGDFLKGFAVVKFSIILDSTSTIIVLTTISVILGHIYPIFLNFKGGKGLATALGAIFAIDYNIIILSAFVFAFIFLFIRSINKSGIMTIILLPFIAFMLSFSMYIITTLLLSTILIIYTHKKNIKQYFSKTKSMDKLI